MLFFSASSPLYDRLMRELQTVESCIEVVAAEMAALCCALQQQKKNVSIIGVAAGRDSGIKPPTFKPFINPVGIILPAFQA